MNNGNPYTSSAILALVAMALAACEGPGAEVTPQPPSDNEQAALEKAEAMLEENRDRLENEETSDEVAGSEE